VVVNFPAAGPFLTQWDLCFEVAQQHGLVIRRASFRPSPSQPHVQVFSDARVAEIFVPYHTGEPRLYDVSGANYSLRPLSASDCPSSVGGTLLAGNLVCREIRSRGVAWKHKAKVRRGEEVVLWGALQAAHHVYIVEWTFQDTGMVRGQVGATGPTLPSSPTEGHMLNATWRLDLDVNGPEGDTAYRTRRLQSAVDKTASDEKIPVATETALLWTPTEFTTVDVFDGTLKNANGRATGYKLIPLRSGTARHREAFTHGDFWITRYNPSEVLAINLPSYLDGEPANDQDVVIWYTGSAHHGEGLRDEASDAVPVKWVGFTLEPQNMFAGTPMFP
jgi:primary-amine oxidase